MKISYLSNSPISSPVANAVHVMNMSSSLVACGHEVILHARLKRSELTTVFGLYGLEDQFEISSVHTGKVKSASPILYGFVQALRAKIIYKPDLCYARCLLSAYFVMLLGMRVVVELHEVPQGYLERLLLKHILNNKKLERVVVISGGLLEDLQAAYPVVSKSAIWLIAHDGANIPSRTEIFPIKGDSGCQVGYAGGLRAGNGLALILKLAEVFPENTFHIAGGKPHEIESWKTFQNSKNIIWYGMLKPSHVPSFLSACDILLAPYQHGPKTARGRDTSRWMSPLKIFEYMASGSPMVVSDFPILREVLNDDLAVMVEPEDFDGWCRALKKLIADDELRHRIGKKAFCELKDSYTWCARASTVLQGINLP